VLTVPLGRLEVVTCRVATAAFTVRLSVPLAAVREAESVTLIVMEEVPLAVGVPPMAPDEDKVKPTGRDPEARLQV
jgi:hypothetical protein